MLDIEIRELKKEEYKMSLNEFNTMNEIAEYIILNFPSMSTGTKQTINSLI